MNCIFGTTSAFCYFSPDHGCSTAKKRKQFIFATCVQSTGACVVKSEYGAVVAGDIATPLILSGVSYDPLAGAHPNSAVVSADK